MKDPLDMLGFRALTHLSAAHAGLLLPQSVAFQLVIGLAVCHRYLTPSQDDEALALAMCKSQMKLA